MSSQNSSFATADFSIAAYLHAHGVELHSARLRHDSRSQYDFHFDDPAHECAGLAIDFVNSDSHRFDQSQRALKKLAFGWKDREQAGDRGDWSTGDMSLAAFVLSQGVRLVGFRRTHPTRREYQFCFDDSDRRCRDLAIDFIHSEAHRFDQSSRALKKLVFSR
jgi:hypothetical protein